jgi:hypothetical protein
MMTNKGKKRKLSWVCEDLAWKIQVPTQAIKLVLTFLAKQANDSGKSYAGYAYLQRCCAIGSDTTVSKALKHLKGLGILSWQKGGQGHESDTNKYTLNIAVMKQVVKAQGFFDLETGKLIRMTPQPTPLSGVGTDTEPTPFDEVTDSTSRGNRLHLTHNRLHSVETNPLIRQPSLKQPSAKQPSGADGTFCDSKNGLSDESGLSDEAALSESDLSDKSGQSSSPALTASFSEFSKAALPPNGEGTGSSALDHPVPVEQDCGWHICQYDDCTNVLEGAGKHCYRHSGEEM